MFRKILSIALAALMLAGLCMAFGSCSKSGDAFKIGVILLHDEKSTYDLNFINGVKTAVEELKKDGKNVEIVFKAGGVLLRKIPMRKKLIQDLQS